MRPPGRGAGAPCAVAVLLLTAAEPVSGQHACGSDYAALHAEYEEKCCGSKGCSGEPPVPSGCSTTCARVWSPFMLRCSTWVEEAMPELDEFRVHRRALDDARVSECRHGKVRYGLLRQVFRGRALSKPGQ